MKLYTEEQVRRAIDEARLVDVVYRKYDELIELLTPIELPSDEEIQEGMAKSLFVSTDPKHKLFNTGTRAVFSNGAKWVIEHIKRQ